MCVLLFQRQAVHLELIRGTHTGLSSLVILVRLSTWVSPICVCVLICTYVETELDLLCSFTMGCNICHAKFENHFVWTDQPCKFSTMWRLLIRREMWSAFTVKQRLCVSFCCGMEGFADGAVADTPSHTVLSLFCYLLINQNQVSL